MSDVAPNSEAPRHQVGAALDTIVSRARSAFESDEFARAYEIINNNLLEIWFGTSPDIFLKMLTAPQAAQHALSPVAVMMRNMLLSGASTTDLTSDFASQLIEQPAAYSNDSVREYVQNVAAVFSLRLQGRPVDALEAARRGEEALPRVQTIFAAPDSIEHFIVLQHGLTAMLAGAFQEAEAKLTEAKLLPSPSTLPFLTRDAHSKLALLHASFGDPVIARAELALADEEPRTSSWIEPVLDAQTQLARALVQADSTSHAIEMLDSIPLNTLGEMWPFYAHAVRVIYERAGQHSEGTRRLETLDQTRLARIDGQGFSGSVIPSALALSALSAGDGGRARDLWQRVDPTLVTSQIGEAMLALASGTPRDSVRICMQTRPRTRGLRQLELWRLTVLANALLVIDDIEGCLEALHSAQALPRGLAPDEAALFHRRVRELAEKEIAHWPKATESLNEPFAGFEFEQRPGLTPREIDVLAALARGLTRDQIATELFLSVNTIKAHQQSLYRKLSVSSRHAAVLEGEQRGLL